MSNHRQQRERVVELWLLTTVFIWAANYPLAKYGLTGLSMTTAGNVTILLSTSPLWIVFFNSRLHR